MLWTCKRRNEREYIYIYIYIYIEVRRLDWITDNAPTMMHISICGRRQHGRGRRRGMVSWCRVVVVVIVGVVVVVQWGVSDAGVWCAFPCGRCVSL